ncbi:MAG: LOG family protein [Desulfobacterales bacterium]|nr:LOG family protein [Desulfobacterales bacterium]
MEIPRIISPDGYLVETFDPGDDGQSIRARFRFPWVSDYVRGALAEGKPYVFSGRSGNAQMGIHTDLVRSGRPILDKQDIFMEGRLENLNPLLGRPLGLFEKGDEVGRLVIMDPELRIRDVRHYLHKRLFVGRESEKGYAGGFEIRRETDPITGQDCDYICVGLENLSYEFEPHALNQSSVGRVIKRGRSALNAIRSPRFADMETTMLQPGQLFVGAVKISLGDIYGIIDTHVHCADDGVVHLPARVMDPFRTFRERQVVLYHGGEEPVPLKDIRIRIRFFRARNPLTVPLEKNKVKEGYRLSDLLTNAEIASLFTAREKDDLGMVFSRNTAVRVPRAMDPQGEAQLEILGHALLESTFRTRNRSRSTEQEKILEKLSALGGVNSRLFCGEEFPPLNVVEILSRAGLRTFLVRGTHPVFTDTYVKQMIHLTHRAPAPCEFLRYDPASDKLYTFYHGCFMEPDDRERFDRVRYWFAFYGSHTHEADKQLTMELIYLLARQLGDEMGIVHGGGPGLMKEANDLARQHNIMSMGIAIELEGENQASLTTCDGLIKYKEGLRLARQDHIQKLSNLPIVNTGGYGSAEELAISMTSMKIHENPLAPIILLDPDRLWDHAVRQIEEIALRKYGPAFTPRLVVPCATAAQASSALLTFLADPGAWYAEREIPMENVEKARVKSARIRGESLAQDGIEVFSRPTTKGRCD